ncbi:MAG TPA: ribonuclease [Novosphingobium sp.]|nr:ribonuclease [Novosphingobium sp.]
MAEQPTSGWYVEEGIGEHRAIRIEGGEVVAAKLYSLDELSAGHVGDAILSSRGAGSPRGTVRFDSGEEALVDGLPREASEGARLRVIVTRAAIGEPGRIKLAQVRPTDRPIGKVPSLAAQLRANGANVRVVHRFPVSEWPELFAEAWSGQIAFAGGALLASPTPAMTLIDIDGTLPPRQLSLAAIGPLARAIGLFDLGGSIGVDFPTLAEKNDRRAVDEALASALADWPHQRTAMNGFGFVQLVARLEGPSLIHRIRQDRVGASAKLLLRRAEMVEEAGALLITAHPAIRQAIRPDWEDELARRTGRMLRWREDPTLALHAGFAQALSA